MGRRHRSLDGGQARLDLGWAGDEAAGVKHALYFAALPDAEVARRLSAGGRDLIRRQGLAAKPSATARLHLSLWGVARSDRLDPDAVAAAKAIGAQVTWPDFDVVFLTAATFGGGSQVFRCADGAYWALTGLRDAIGAASEDLGFGCGPSRAFEPHLTFARGPDRMDPTVLDEPIRWAARELVLVHSEQGRGRRHCLARWPLSRGRIA